MAPNLTKLSQKRKVTAIIQGLCGALAIACGIALFPLKPGGTPVGYWIEHTSRVIAHGGFGVWGGLIIAATAVMGYFYRENKAMISVYAAFSLVSMTVAIILLSVAITGLSRYAQLSEYRCDQDTSYSYYHSRSCCINDRYCANYRSPHYDRQVTTVPITDPLDDFNSEECQRIRYDWEVECRKVVKTAKSGNLAVLTILLVTSVIEFAVSITAAVMSFVVVCRGCCKGSTQPVVYLAYPQSGHPGAVPMVLIPGTVPGTGTPLMTGVAAPNTMVSPYPPSMTAVNPNMGSGPYLHPMPTNAMAAMQEGAAPPPEYEAVDEDVKKLLVDN